MSPKYHEKITKFTQFVKGGFKEYFSAQVELTTTAEKWHTTPSGYKRKEIVEETTKTIEVFNTLEEAEAYLASVRPVKATASHRDEVTQETVSERFM